MKKLPLDEVHVDELLVLTLGRGCVELHLEAGRAPAVRRDGEQQMDELPYESASAANVQSMVYDIISDEQIIRFENEMKLSFGHQVRTVGRFLVLVMRDDKGQVAASFRMVLNSEAQE